MFKELPVASPGHPLCEDSGYIFYFIGEDREIHHRLILHCNKKKCCKKYKKPGKKRCKKCPEKS